MANAMLDRRVFLDTLVAGDATVDYRARLAGIQALALKHWKQQLAEQSSVLNSAADRIRVWERRHQIDLPRNPEHRLVQVIAAATGLRDEDVRAEQQLRATAASPIVDDTIQTGKPACPTV